MITEHEKHGDKDLPQSDRKENDDNLDSKVNTDFTREEGESQTIQEDPNKEPAEKAPFKRSNV
ncbi:MAG: hypothetical protein EOP06_11415 [Proteobacteria bacterium]|nr:MAG: hypothetical protein EOP06_11415 [Pseudomonadota bacterium]